MGAKTHEVFYATGAHYAWYVWCPACCEPHGFDKRWNFSGDHERPTFMPSMLARWTEGEPPVAKVCHSYLEAGVWRFLEDCTHAMKGQKVPAPDWTTFARMTDESSPKAPEATETHAPQAPAQAPEKADEAPIVLDEDEPSAGDVVIAEPQKAVRAGGQSSHTDSEPSAPPEASTDAPPPPAVEPADKADPWGTARHEDHKAEIARARPERPELPADRELSFDEFRAAHEPQLEAFLRREYQDYLEDFRRTAKPAV